MAPRKVSTPLPVKTPARVARVADTGFGRRTVSMPRDVLAEVERRVGQREFSAWMTDAARMKLEREHLDELLADWPLSTDAVDEARARLRAALEEAL